MTAETAQDPTPGTWTQASPRLVTARALSLWLTIMIPIAPTSLVALLIPLTWMWWIVGALVAIGLWLTWLIVRQVSAHAWSEQADDLVIKRGRVFRRTTVIPYGRMQYVDLNAGPFDRAVGIAKLTLHTASPETAGVLSGVLASDADALRERLVKRGEARLAGL